MELLYHLLPDKTNLQLETWDLDEAQASIKLMLFSTQALVKCPVCSKPTHRIHSRYERTLADLPWADYSITLQLRVRKFFCINTLCKRRIFTERLASVTAPWARRTVGMETQQWYSIKSVPKVIEQELISLTPRRAAWLDLGKAGSKEHIDAVIQVARRGKIDALQRAMSSLYESWLSLYEESQPESTPPSTSK